MRQVPVWLFCLMLVIGALIGGFVGAFFWASVARG